MSEVRKFRKKPVVVEAVQFTGDNDAECLAFCSIARDPEDTGPSLVFMTLDGNEARIRPGWWIIKGVQGEFYPCEPNVFLATYDPVDG